MAGMQSAYSTAPADWTFLLTDSLLLNDAKEVSLAEFFLMYSFRSAMNIPVLIFNHLSLTPGLNKSMGI